MCVKDMDAPADICHMRDLSVNFVDMLWTISSLSFDL